MCHLHGEQRYSNSVEKLASLVLPIVVLAIIETEYGSDHGVIELSWEGLMGGGGRRPRESGGRHRIRYIIEDRE